MQIDIKKLVSRTIDILIARGLARNHWRRYVLGAFVSVVGICALAGAYLVLMPRSYTSQWAVILPGAGVDSRVSVDRLGQAQSNAQSPFSGKELSPRVNYKEIAVSQPVIRAAAQQLNLPSDTFGKPSVKLVDQTSIITFQISGSSPERAQTKARALHLALTHQLNSLRADEVKWRNLAISDSIYNVEQNLIKARKALLNLQQTSGLASIEQYNQMVASVETLRREYSAAQAKHAESQSIVTALSEQVGVHPDAAKDLLMLSADPEFRQLWTSYAKASAAHAENASRLGLSHPRAAETISRKNSIETMLHDLLVARQLDNISLKSGALASLDHDRVSHILGELINRQSELAGTRARIAEIARQLTDYEDRRQKLDVVAAKLDDLERDHKIANAVFSSALARIDASKSDIYASYPLLQILEAPTLPLKPSSPRPIFAVAGAFLGSLLAIMSWTFAWLHQWFAQIRLTKRLSFLQYA